MPVAFSASDGKVTAPKKKKKKSLFDNIGGWLAKDVKPYTVDQLTGGLAHSEGNLANPQNLKKVIDANPITGSTALGKQDWGKVFDPAQGGVGPYDQILAGLSPAGALANKQFGHAATKPKASPWQGIDFGGGLQFGNKAPVAQQPEQAPELPAFGKTLADYLGIANSQTGSGIANQLAALEASKQSAQGSAAAGDSKLAAMYQALQNVTGKDNADAQARYQQAQQQSQALTQQNQAALTGANQAVQSDQDQTLANLGIAGSTSRPGGAQGTQNEYAQVGNSGVQAIGNAAGQNLIAGGLAQGDYGAKMGTAAQFAGAGRRADLQNALQKALADIGQSEASLRDSAAQQSSSLASQMYNNDYQQFQDQRNYAANRDDEAYRRAQAGAQTQDPSKLQGGDAVLYHLQQAGVAPKSQQTIMSLIQQGLATPQVDPKTGKAGSSFASIYSAIQNAVAAGKMSSADASQALQAASSVFAPRS